MVERDRAFVFEQAGIRYQEDETFTIRTDYTITEEEVAGLIQEVLTNTQMPEVNVYMFMGVLTVEI